MDYFKRESEHNKHRQEYKNLITALKCKILGHKYVLSGKAEDEFYTCKRCDYAAVGVDWVRVALKPEISSKTGSINTLITKAG